MSRRWHQMVMARDIAQGIERTIERGIAQTGAAALAVALALSGCAVQDGAQGVPGKGGAAPAAALAAPVTPAPSPDVPPPAPREFRAAWVSTVANIDWPSRSNLPVLQQQAEIISVLERVKSLNMNAVILQVRPSADAIYPSPYEPWSEYLTGTQGRAPEPFYDPLKMWVEQAHARGLELHAWFNPYRARLLDARSPAAPSHIVNTHPSSVRQYGKYQWMDPGDAWAMQRTIDVFLDVVKRYDIDGVHIDDYFYPYPVEAPRAPGSSVNTSADLLNAALPATRAASAAPAAPAELDFPDEPSWQAYQAGGGTLARADWRRQNVNDLIERLYAGVHKEKSWVRFGISPFGIGRPDRRPPGICCFSQYDKLYADAELWLDKGWLDYLAPQLYWPIDQKPQAFGVLLDYWNAQNTRGRHVWPGLFTSRIDHSEKSWKAGEIINQIDLTHGKADGHVHFSMAALMQNRNGIADQLRAGPYAWPALVPATPWLGSEPPGAPKVELVRLPGRTVTTVTLTPAPGHAATHWALWARYGGQWRFSVVPAQRNAFEVADDGALGAPDLLVLSAVDRLGNESARISVRMDSARTSAAQDGVPGAGMSSAARAQALLR